MVKKKKKWSEEMEEMALKKHGKKDMMPKVYWKKGKKNAYGM